MRARVPYVAIAVLILSGPTAAQVPPNPASPHAPVVNGTVRCAPTALPNSAGGNSASPTAGQSQEPLSDKLARSDGVLCPPANSNPDIRVPVPESGNTPVIPPPGSPGGDPSVRPK